MVLSWNSVLENEPQSCGSYVGGRSVQFFKSERTNNWRQTSHLQDEFSNCQVRLSRDVPIHFATLIFFLSELEYKYLPLEIFIKRKLAFQLSFFTSIERMTQSYLRKNDLYWQYCTEIWTWGCYLLIVFVFGCGLVLFHLVVDGKNIIFPWYKEFQSCRKHSFPDWIIEYSEIGRPTG